MSNKIKVHIKNNHFSPSSFPNTPEGEEVFTITRRRFDDVAKMYPDIADRLDVFIDWDTDNFETSIADSEVLVAWDLPTDNLINAAPNLKWIHIIGAGVEHLTPMNWIPEGVKLVNNKGVHAAKGGEFGLMSILMLHNAMPAIVTNQRTATYDSIYSTPIAGKTVVVIGTGSIGKSVAAHAKTIGLHVIGVSRHGKPIDEVDKIFSVDKIDEALPLGDYIFVVTPLTDETRGLLDRRRLDLLKPGAGLVNIGRAEVVDYIALSEKLQSGEISGAILDVFEQEPLPKDSEYWNVPNLIVTPHVSADDGNAYVKMTLTVFFENMKRYIDGEELNNQVNSALGY